MSQKGIPNAISQAMATPDLLSFRKADSIAPTSNYLGQISHAAISTGQVPVGIVYCCPLVMPKGLLLNKFCYRVTVPEAGEVLRVGIYSNKPGTLFPQTLVKDFGEYSIAGAGVFWSATLDYFLYGKSVHWLATWVSAGAAWFGQLSATGRLGLCGYNSAGEVEQYPGDGFKFTKAYDGIFPDPYPDYAAGTRFHPTDENIPGIFLRLHNP